MSKLLGVAALCLLGSSPLAGHERPSVCRVVEMPEATSEAVETPTPDDEGVAVYDVGLDLHLLATIVENCRRDASCHEQFRELPDPWSGDSDRTRETEKFLESAARLWDQWRMSIDSTLPDIEPVYETPTRLFYLADSEQAKSIRDALDVVGTNVLQSNNFAGDLGALAASRSSRWQAFVESSTILHATPRIQIRSPIPRKTPAAIAREGPGPSEAIPDDPLLWAQWALAQTQVLRTWEDVTSGSTPVRIALIDSGIDPEQDDVEHDGYAHHYCLRGVDSKCDPTDTSDPAGHGTALAGILAANADNAYRVAGTHRQIDLLNLKALGTVSDGTVTGTVLDAVRALEEATNRCSAVAVLAWGVETDSQALWEAILRARAGDVLVVTGGGNDQLDLDHEKGFYPASFRHPDHCQLGCPCLDNLLAVGATTLRIDEQDRVYDKKASFSNHGNSVIDIGAPGVGITTLWLHDRRGGVVDATGTSAATALVAGAAALVSETLPSNPPPRDRFFAIRERLLRGADRVEGLCGAFAEGRRLNVYNAALGIPVNDVCVCSERRSP